MGVPVDPRLEARQAAQTAVLRRGAAVLSYPPGVVDVPFGEARLPGYFFSAADGPGRRATVILRGGYDGTAEKQYFLTRAAARAAEASWTNVRFTDVEARERGSDCIVLAYHGTGRQTGDKKAYRGSVASTYIRRDGRSQLALSAHQPWKSDARRAG